MVPYRENARNGAAPPVHHFVYRPYERIDQRSGLVRAFRVAVLPTGIGSLVWRAAGVTVGVAAFAVLLIASLAGSRRTRGGVGLHIIGGELRVFRPGQKVPIWTSPLRDLTDVVLETKTIERVVEGGSTALGITSLGPRVAPPTDTNRIVLERRDGERHALSDDFLGHFDTLDWFAKIRLFLRRNEWVPQSERA